MKKNACNSLTDRLQCSRKLTRGNERRVEMEKLTVKQIRVGMDMSQEKMAEFLGICTRSYRKKESGETRFYFEEILKICQKANISLDAVKL